jgi:hypothetical protein
VEPADWERIDGLLEQYDDPPLGTVDASVISACERLDARELATLDPWSLSGRSGRGTAQL